MTTLADDQSWPSWRFLFAHPAHFIALGLGSGLVPVAPGTFGSLAAIPLYFGMNALIDTEMQLLVLLVAFGVGVWACGKTGRDLGILDHAEFESYVQHVIDTLIPA